MTEQPEPGAEELEGANVRPDAPEGESADAGPEEATRATPPRLTKRGADFIARFEGCVLHLYNDPTNNATIGIGHLVHMGPINGSEPAEFKSGITRQRAVELLQQDARGSAAAVARLITVPLNEQQADALISFTFNVGEGNLQSSTLRRLLNTGDYDSVPAQMARWVFSAGQKLPGLVKRRTAEGVLFGQGLYE